MLKICICDDDMAFGTMIEAFIEEYASKIDGMNVEIDLYESGASLVHAVLDRKEYYQILFLDMEMQGLNGIETAQKIRAVDKELYIIYITSYEKYSLESFKVSPFRYMLKPIDKDDFQAILALVIEEIMMNRQFLFFKYHNVQYQIKCNTIISITSEKGRILHISSSDSETPFIFYGKIKEIEKELNVLLFVKVNPGTIVNLHYVHIITKDVIKMDNGELYSISRGQKQEVKAKYNHFLERRIGL